MIDRFLFDEAIALAHALLIDSTQAIVVLCYDLQAGRWAAADILNPASLHDLIEDSSLTLVGYLSKSTLDLITRFPTTRPLELQLKYELAIPNQHPAPLRIDLFVNQFIPTPSHRTH